MVVCRVYCGLYCSAGVEIPFCKRRDSSSCPEVFPGSRIPVAGADSDVGIVAGVGLYVSSSGVCASDTGVRTVLGGYIGPGLHNGVYPRRKGFCHPKSGPQPGTVEVGFGG